MSNGASEGDFDLSGPEMLDRSSADFDHALRDIDRRSPVPLFDGVKDLDDDGVAGRDGMGSNVPTLGKERSKTDLGNSVSLVPWRKPMDGNVELRNKHPQQYVDTDRDKETRKARRLTCWQHQHNCQSSL